MLTSVDNIKMEKGADLESSSGVMGLLTMVNLKIIILMEKVLISGKIIDSILVTG